MQKQFDLHKGYCPHIFHLCRAGIRLTQPTQIVRASSCPQQKSCRLCSDKDSKEGDNHGISARKNVCENEK